MAPLSQKFSGLHAEVSRLAHEMGPGHGLCCGCEIFYGKLTAILDRYSVPPEGDLNIPLGDLLEGIEMRFEVDSQEMVVKETGAVCIFGDGEKETSLGGLRRMVKTSSAAQKLIKEFRKVLGAEEE